MREINDTLVAELMDRVRAAGPGGISGRRLSTDLCLRSTRDLRRLVSHARVAGKRRELVGVPGAGYFWAPENPARARRIRLTARRMGRSWFYIGALLDGVGTATAIAQLVLDFVKLDDSDDLSSLVAAHGCRVADVIQALSEKIGGSPISSAPEGRAEN